MNNEIMRLWDEDYRGPAEIMHLATKLAERGVDLTFPDATTLTGDRDDAPVRSLTDIFWNYDPAASCPRRRAFVDINDARYMLVAYEDGDWYIEGHRGAFCSGGPRVTERGWVRDKTERWPLVGPLVDAKISALVALRALVTRR